MKTSNHNISLDLIEKAQIGCRESLSGLTDAVQGDLYAYLLRLTLDPHLTEDLCQETLLEIVKHLPNVAFVSKQAFWAWLYKIALSKVSHHFRKKKPTKLSGEHLKDVTVDAELAPPLRLMHKELTATIRDAIASLKISYRNIITLRCFEQLSYAEIAGLTGSTQMQAKLQFFRAKRALERHLKRNDFKASHLLPALGLFAALTGKSVKASSLATRVDATALDIGRGVTILGLATSKTGVLVMAACLAIVTGYSVYSSRTVPEQLPLTLSLDVNTSDPSAALSHIMKDARYSFPMAITNSSDPGSNGWRYTVSQNRSSLHKLQSTEPEAVLIRDQSLTGKCLILPEDQWIQVTFAQPLFDANGVDLFLTGYGLTGKPTLALVDSNDTLRRLSPSMVRDQPSGFTISAFDLAELDQSGSISQIRLSGTSPQTGHPPFQLRMIRARLTPD